MKMNYQFLSKKVLLFVLVSLFLSKAAFSNPTGGTITSGNASINQSGNTMTITQISNQAIINWNGFSINPFESVQFLQPTALSAVLNRVIGMDPSIIQGSLKANGQVFLVNPNGILFAPTAVVDVAGLIATTLTLSDQSFLNRNYVLSQDPTKPLGAVINQGTIKAAPQGSIFLVAPLVDNEGTIVATLGQVQLGAGTQAIINMDGKGYVNFVVNSAQVPRDVTIPQGGLTSLLQQVINNHNIVEAGSVSIQNGQVVLGASEGTLVNNGTISALGAPFQQGGQVTLNSTQATYLGSNSLINTSGQGISSNGGAIHILSLGNTFIDSGSQLQSEGGYTGDGGFIETSAKNNFWNNGLVNTSAVNGSWGTYLIDPFDITIVQGGGTLDGSLPNITFATPNNGPNTVSKPFLQAQMSNIVLQASNTITVNNIVSNGGTITLANNVSLDMETLNGDISFVNPTNTIITSGTGGITIHAGENVGSGGQIIAGNLTSTGTGVISLMADGNVSFGTINSGGAVTLNSANGSIVSTGGTQVFGPSLVATSSGGIGSLMTPLGTSVSSITASTTGTNAGIYLNNALALSNLAVTTANSDVNVLFGGGQSLTFVNATGALNAAATGTDVNFNNTNGGISLGLVDVGNANNVTLTSSGAITSGGMLNNINADTATLTGASVGTSVSPINTTINTLNATATSGPVNLINTGALVANSVSSSGTGNDVVLTNTAGDLLLGQISSGGGIFLTTTLGSIFDNTNNAVTNLTAAGSSTLTSQGVIGTVADPVLVQIQGILGISSTGIQNGNSVAISGTVSPSNTLTILNSPSGNVFFNGLLFALPLTSIPSSPTNPSIALTTPATMLVAPTTVTPTIVGSPFAAVLRLVPTLTFQSALQVNLINEITDTFETGESAHESIGCHGGVSASPPNFASINSSVSPSGKSCP